MTPQELFTQFNAIRVKHSPDGRPLKWKTWRKPFERAMKEAPDSQHLLDAWTLFWTEPSLEWHRTVPANKAAYFLRAKNLPPSGCATGKRQTTRDERVTKPSLLI